MLVTNVEVKGSYVQIVRFVARCALFFSVVQYSMLSCLIEGRTRGVSSGKVHERTRGSRITDTKISFFRITNSKHVRYS